MKLNKWAIVANGALTDTMFSDSFGLGLGGGEGATSGARYGWVGSYSESGLYDLRARFYDASAGTFLGQDPLLGSNGNPVTQHRFLYAGADPVNYVDSTGRSLMSVSMGIAGRALLTASLTASAWRAATMPAQIYADSQDLQKSMLRAQAYRFPDVKEPTISVLQEAAYDYGNASIIQMQIVAHNLVGAPSLGAWDIIELTNQGGTDNWIDDEVNKFNSTALGGVVLKEDLRFVVMDNETFHSYSANYVFYGHMVKLAGFSKSTALKYVVGSKLLRPTIPTLYQPWVQSAGKDMTAATAWASAGHDEWFAGGSETPSSLIESMEPIPFNQWGNSSTTFGYRMLG